jgi:hypothetical protein
MWLVTSMHYDLRYFDDETCRLEPIEGPFGPEMLPMSEEWTAASAAAKANGTTFANLHRRSVPRLGCRNRVLSTTGPLQFPVVGTP